MIWVDQAYGLVMPPAAACDLLIGIEPLPWFKGRTQCVLFNSQLLATCRQS